MRQTLLVVGTLSATMLIIAFLNGAFSGCKSSVVDQANSPDGAYVVQVFQYLCGAATGGSYTHVNLHRQATIFGITMDKDVFVYENFTPVKVRWLDTRVLLIEHPCDGLQQEFSWDQVAIKYRKYEPLSPLACRDRGGI